MIRFFYVVAAAAIAMLTSCSGEPTMQTYFVDKSEEKDFVAVDISPNFINTDSISLSPDEKKALESVDNVNILVFQPDSTNTKKYEQENTTVKSLLKNDKYDELMKFNYNGSGASISTKGEGEHLEEFVVYLHNPENGFGLVRVTGKDMTPTNVMTVAGLLQKANLDMKQLEPLKQIIKK